MGYVDTDLTRGFDVPKSSAEDIVKRALDGLEAGLDEVRERVVDELCPRAVVLGVDAALVHP